MLSHLFDLRGRDVLAYNLADGGLQHFIAAGTGNTTMRLRA